MTITEIILPDGKESVEIPNTIGEKNVAGTAEDIRDKVSSSSHTHQNEQEATCEKQAVCKICGSYGEPAAHTLTKTEAIEPTCTDDGNVQYWTCSVCQKNFSDENGSNEITDTVIPAANHTMTHTERKEPACTEAGNIEYWTCSVCNKIFGDENAAEEIALAETVTAALGHDYVNGKCTRCQEIKPDHEHIGGTATCTQKAVCEICHNEYGELAAHIPDSGTVTKQPTASETGVRTFKCTVCGDVMKTETIPALGGGSKTPSGSTKPADPVIPDNGIPFIKNENEERGQDSGDISDSGSSSGNDNPSTGSARSIAPLAAALAAMAITVKRRRK